MNKGKKIAIIGKGASGKDYLATKLKNLYNLTYCIPFTTRPVRPLEQNNKDYRFVTPDTIDTDNALYKSYYTISKTEEWIYGMYKDDFNMGNLLIISPYDFINLPQHIKNELYVVYIDCPQDLIYERLSNRVSPDDISRRMSTDNEIFSKINMDEIDFTINGVVSDEVIEEMIINYNLHAR
ncbi:MAG: hypothetical protein ACRDD8_11010 [Bacteroidales bacterium]